MKNLNYEAQFIDKCYQIFTKQIILMLHQLL